MDFKQWMREVDAAMIALVGVSSGDIADWLYYDAFEAGVDPAEAAQEALEADDLYSMFFGG